MSKKLIQKNISFENVAEFSETLKGLMIRQGATEINFGGNVIQDAKSDDIVVRINLSWKEEETF